MSLYLTLFGSIVCILIYLIFCRRDGVSDISDIVVTILAIIAGIAFWTEYHHNNKVNEAEFVMELNNQFITDENMTQVEHILERYYALVLNNASAAELAQYQQYMEKLYDIEKGERQNLVNYLVHLEGIATLVNSGILRLNTINDLMAYRYFIAVNNPVVQKLELIPYKPYYNGCFTIFEEWSKTTDDMPMKETPLAEISEKKTKVAAK